MTLPPQTLHPGLADGPEGMVAVYDQAALELTIYCRPWLLGRVSDELDFSTATDHPLPLRVATADLDDARGYAVKHTWSGIRLELSTKGPDEAQA